MKKEAKKNLAYMPSVSSDIDGFGEFGEKMITVMIFHDSTELC